MNELLIAVVSVLIASFVGGIIGYFLSLRLSLKEKRRELILTYLISAYTDLENSTHRQLGEELERAIATIQLFGTTKQIDLARNASREFSKNQGANLDELLYDLRNSLRRELALDEYKDGITHLRVIRSE